MPRPRLTYTGVAMVAHPISEGRVPLLHGKWVSPSRTGTPFIPRRLPILRVRAFYSPWYGYSFSESRGPTTEGHVPLFRGTLSPPLRGTVVPRFKGTGSNFGRSCTPLPWEA